ncbi:MAG TPA: hypothetical protein VEV42_09745 [Pyrinomonadaceae bacterium]|nr:hypothetical protein [Pyrinomonadaceae bacterium]
MSYRASWFVLALLLCCSSLVLAQQQPANGNAGEKSRPEITATYVIGEVAAIAPDNKQIQLKIDKTIFTAVIDERTKYLRLKPGETKLANAQPAALTDLGVGDRVMALGTVSMEQKTVPAHHVILMKKDDLAQRLQREREAWRARGIAGRISAINADTKELTVQVGERPVLMKVGDNVTLRRYNSETVTFSDTRPSKFEDLKVGDQIRALGEKSADGASFTPEEIVSGSFRMIGGRVVAINPEAKEITVRNIQPERQITVKIKDGSTLRRMKAENVAMLLQRRPAQGQQGDPVERLPLITFNDLKQGDTVIVSSAVGPNPGRANAIILVAGAEALLNGQQRPANRGPNLSLGLPTGVFDGVISP